MSFRPTLDNMLHANPPIDNTSISDQMCTTQLLDTSIEEVRNKQFFFQKILASTMDSVRRLMREVECEEIAADRATKEAALSTLNTLVNMDKRNQAFLNAEAAKNTLARKVNIERDVLAIKVELLHCRVAKMLAVEDRSLDALNEMCEALKERLTCAIRKKEFANDKKQENELALASKELEIKKVIEEFNRLQQKISENSKLQALLKDYDNITYMLKKEITARNEDVNLLKE